MRKPNVRNKSKAKKVKKTLPMQLNPITLSVTPHEDGPTYTFDAVVLPNEDGVWVAVSKPQSPPQSEPTTAKTELEPIPFSRRMVYAQPAI